MIYGLNLIYVKIYRYIFVIAWQCVYAVSPDIALLHRKYFPFLYYYKSKFYTALSVTYINKLDIAQCELGDVVLVQKEADISTTAWNYIFHHMNAKI
jgi:hypothetical protein